MTEAETLVWFERLSKGWNPGNEESVANTRHAVVPEWVSEAESALASVFPAEHPVRTSWAAARKRAQANKHYESRPAPELGIVVELEGYFRSAERQLREGRLKAFAETVRVETVGECLDVASNLADKGEAIAATVLAGGALEVHLLHLCNRLSVRWSGHGSISAYNDALAQARNAGASTILASDTKLVTAWGARRNEAAHEPTKFVGTIGEVRLMVEGIRQFISRTL